jgi:DNA segregation ATPase FtsK/SpoIIIE, S-DNA-T family
VPTSCKFPDHHGNGKSEGSFGLVLLAAAVLVFVRYRHDLAEIAHWVVVGLVVLVAVVVVAVVIRLVVRHRGRAAGFQGDNIQLKSHSSRNRLPWLRHVPRALWAACTWRWVSRNLSLAGPDRHRPGRVRRPRALIWPHRHGVAARIRTTPGTGRVEVEAVAQHLADHWRVARVSITQPRPHILKVRALAHDPLLELLTLADAPPADVTRPHRVWLGRDEHGADRWLDLRNISGVCVGGQPGGGKSQGITSWETQLAPSPAVQFVNVDGKGAGEFDDFEPRAWITAGDSMDRMLDVLDQLTTLMYERLATVRDFTGGRKNIWTVGVSAAWPLQFSVFDETQTFFDLPAARALGKEQEKACAQAIKLASELVRKGRSVGMCSVFATQKPTSDSLPSSISANCALSVAYSLKTLDAAKATLGPDIGDYPLLSPVSLSLPDYAGVCVVSLRDGMAPFTRLRSPMVTEDQAAAVVAANAHLRRDPRTALAVPDDASSLVP